MSTANQIRARELPDQTNRRTFLDIRARSTLERGTEIRVTRGPYTQLVLRAACSRASIRESWSAVNSGLTTLSVNSWAIDPQDSSTVCAAATVGGGVFVISFAP